MYFSSRTLIDVLSDETLAAQAAAAIEADRKRLTSPMAVIETVLALAAPEKLGKSHEEVEALVLGFLDGKEIEIREFPPAHKTVTLSLAAAAELGSGSAAELLHKAFADYYEVATFSLADALAPASPATES